MSPIKYESVKRVVDELLSAERIGDETIIRLPLIMPGGSSATVRVIENDGQVFVGDMGLAYIQADSLGFAASFWNTAISVAERYALERNKSELFVRVPHEQLYRAVCDVAAASWQIADTIAGKAEERAVEELSENVSERLIRIFGHEKVHVGPKVAGLSHWEWDVTAIVKVRDHDTVFQAVGKNAQSVYKTSTAFHDLSALEEPPKLVAVVKSRDELGNRLGLLSHAGRVIEEGVADPTYEQAAA